MSDESGFSVDEIKSAAQQLVRAGQDVRAKLHELTVKALTQRQLAEKEIKEVLAAITEGVSLGASERADEVRLALGDALHGMDDALGHAAEAMQHAWSEVSAHAQEFAEQDLKEGIDELKKLEGMFLETVGRTAQEASGLVKQEMAALVEQARGAGTGSGKRVKAVVDDLSSRLRTTAHLASDAGRHAARQVGARAASLASRKLAEMAAKIEEKAQALKQENQ
jgi:hypothetical protein